LTPEHRAIVVLHHYVGMPLVEIAGVLLIAPGTARSRLHYAIRVLRAALDADAREPGDLATLITDIAK
jgi:RNA polymerase sigma-70 factor (ECF subfamily)